VSCTAKYRTEQQGQQLNNDRYNERDKVKLYKIGYTTCSTKTDSQCNLQVQPATANMEEKVEVYITILDRRRYNVMTYRLAID